MAKTKWVFDPTHSELSFRIRHLMISNVSGQFSRFEVNMETEGDDIRTASIEMTADMRSINTNNEQRDAHLRQSDFFEAEKYPQLHFRSTRIEEAGDDHFTVSGNLEMKGVSQPVELHVEYNRVDKDPWGNQRAGFSVTAKINRSDWGIGFNTLLETGKLALGEEVKVTAEVQLVKQSAAVAA